MNKEDLRQIKDLFKAESRKTEKLFRKEFTAQNEDLARMMQDQFAEQDKKFAGIDEKFAGIDEKFAGIDEKFAGIDEKFAVMDNNFIAHTKKIEKIIEPLKNSIDGLAKKFLDQSHENTANIGAHDRFNENFYKIKKHIKLDTVEAVKPM